VASLRFQSGVKLTTTLHPSNYADGEFVKAFSVVGAAYEMWFRFHLQKLHQIQKDVGLNENMKYGLLKYKQDNPLDFDSKKEKVISAWAFCTDYIHQERVNNRVLLESCMELGLMDLYYHGNVMLGYTEQELYELYRLIQYAYPYVVKTFIGGNFHCNPDFGRWGLAMEGADADIILDDLLFDIKTVTQNGYDERFIGYTHQIIGYYCLAQLEGNYPDIQKLGIYFARHNQLIYFHIDDLKNQFDFKAFLEAFRELYEPSYVKLNRKLGTKR
jgi:hypothetical protein